jgi:hypothetical protein
MPRIRPCPICAEWRLISLVTTCPICKSPGAKPELDALILKFTQQYASGGAFMKHKITIITYKATARALEKLTNSEAVQAFCQRHCCSLRVWSPNKNTTMYGFTGPKRVCAAVFELPNDLIQYCHEDSYDLHDVEPLSIGPAPIIESPRLIAECEKRRIAPNPSAHQIWEFLSYDGKLPVPASKLPN